MEELLIKGALWGTLCVVAWRLIRGVKHAARSQTEGARRMKLVIKAVLTLVGLAMFIDAFGVATFIGSCIALAVIVWVYRGYKKP